MRTSTAKGERLMMQIAAGVLAVCMTCGLAWGAHYTYGDNGEFGSGRFQGANASIGTKIDSTDDTLSIRFTALENVTLDRIHLRYSSNGSATFTVGIMADNGAGNPDGTFLVSTSTNFTYTTLTTWVPEIVFGSSLNLSNGSVYHIVTQPTSIQTSMDLRYLYNITVSDVRPFDRAYDPKMNILQKLNGAAIWNLKNYTPWFILANGSSTGFVPGPGQPYNLSTITTVNMTGGGVTRKARGQTFVITAREIPADACVCVTQAVVKVTKAGSVTNNIRVELRDTDSSLTLLGSAMLLNSQIADTVADTLFFSPPVTLRQGRKYLLAFEFAGAPPATTADEIIIEDIRAVGYPEATWGGNTDGVVVESAPNYAWTSYAPVGAWVGYDMRFSLTGRVARNAGGTTLLIR
jgi:hypothetical protein